MLSQKVTGVEVALAPGFLSALRDLPVVEARTEAAGDGLFLFCPLIMTEAVV